MNRDNVAFLLGGLAFGILIGFGAYHAVQSQPDLRATGGTPGGAMPQGPPSPTQMGGPNAGGGAPMVAEVNRLKRMLQDDPANAQVLLRLANLYHDAAMWTQAVDYYERASELDPDDPNLLTDLGVCYRGLGQYDKALDAFERARAIDPTHWQSMFNTVIVAAFDLDRKEVAMKALESMEALDPRPPELAEGRLEELRRALEAGSTGATGAS